MVSSEEISKKCGEISNGVVKEPWYVETLDGIISAQKEICSRGAGIKPLFSKYDAGCLKIHCKIEELIYKIAFEDGIKFGSDCTKAKSSLVSKLVSKPK
jgi:hypothetical protein